jgi:hypothetical protein
MNGQRRGTQMRAQLLNEKRETGGWAAIAPAPAGYARRLMGSDDACSGGRRRPEPARLGRAWVPVNGQFNCLRNGHAQLHNNLHACSTAIWP